MKQERQAKGMPVETNEPAKKMTVREMILGAHNMVNGNALLANAVLPPPPRDKEGSFALVLDCSKSCMGGKIWPQLQEIIQIYVKSPRNLMFQYVSVLVVRTSYIRLLCCGNDREMLHLDLREEDGHELTTGSGMSPIYAATLLALQYAEKVLVVSDFRSNDRYYGLDEKQLLRQIREMLVPGANTVPCLLCGLVDTGRRPLRPPGECILPFSRKALTPQQFREGLYRVERYIAMTDPFADTADSLSEIQDFCNHKVILPEYLDPLPDIARLLSSLHTTRGRKHLVAPNSGIMAESGLPTFVVQPNILVVTLVLDRSCSMAGHLEELRDLADILLLQSESEGRYVDISILSVRSTGEGTESHDELMQVRGFSSAIHPDADERSNIRALADPGLCSSISPVCLLAEIARAKCTRRQAAWEQHCRERGLSTQVRSAVILCSDFCCNDFTQTDAYSDTSEMRARVGLTDDTPRTIGVYFTPKPEPEPPGKTALLAFHENKHTPGGQQALQSAWLAQLPKEKQEFLNKLPKEQQEWLILLTGSDNFPFVSAASTVQKLLSALMQ